MTTVIILGHGGYASAVRRNLSMLVGDPEGFRYVDFNEQDDLNILKDNIAAALEGIEGGVLFACDLAGGSPFRETAALCIDRDDRAVVAGLNTSAYAEVTLNTELAPRELAQLAMDVAKETIMMFPLPQEE